MAVPPSQLAVLASLERPKSVMELAAENRAPYPAVYKAVQELEHRGVVASHREGKELVVESTATAVPQLARSLLLEFPRQDWGSVFRGDRPVLLHVLDRVGEVQLTGEICGRSTRAVYLAIAQHAKRGLLVQQGGKYRINPRLKVLKSLLDALARAESFRQLKEVDPLGRPIWWLGPEVLFKREHEIRHPSVQLAALSRFGELGVPLLTLDAKYYYIATRRLDAADAILQGLLVEPESTVNRAYCALAYEKARPPNLPKKGRVYGLEQEAGRLVQYVETHEQPGFLPWREHERYREQYGVRR